MRSQFKADEALVRKTPASQVAIFIKQDGLAGCELWHALDVNCTAKLCFKFSTYIEKWAKDELEAEIWRQKCIQEKKE